MAANALDEKEGFGTGFKEGLISIGKSLRKAIAYGSSYWASKACSTWSSECAATHQLIRDEGGNIGLAAYELTMTDANNVSMIASNSTTAGGYIGGRIIGVGTLSGATTPALKALGGSGNRNRGWFFWSRAWRKYVICFRNVWVKFIWKSTS